MNLPNRLTLSRIVITPLVCIAIALQKDCMYVAAILFALGALTDFADGRIARKRGLITNFGKFLDPIADKLLVLCPMILLVAAGRLPAWMCALIVAREITVSGFRLIAALENRVIAADMLGKYKTTSQMLTVLFLMLFTTGFAAVVGIILSYIATALTVLSGAECIWKNIDVLKE